MWKNSPDGHKRNPIAPDYQITMITYGIDGNDDLEFLQRMRKQEAEKKLDFNPYFRRLVLAEAFYTLKKNKKSSGNCFKIKDLRIER